ncbi:MAG: hypothetical protein QOI13_3537 [Paraburkholderia sp.]|jgi:predicted NAD/FAD-dependent oxidoreductase|nr:hypothetical protein [Paraburkholderia sp.]
MLFLNFNENRLWQILDVAILGAGTAGLAAVREVKAAQKSFVLIDHGPLGTMCARVGCMPSKAVLHAGALIACSSAHRQALIYAKQSGLDPFAAIEAVMSWDAFTESVTEAQKLAQPDDFDFLHRIGESALRADRIPHRRWLHRGLGHRTTWETQVSASTG